MTLKGQTTIPKQIREHLNLHPGDKVDFIVDENGEVNLKPSTYDITELEGILHKPGMKLVTVDEKMVRKSFNPLLTSPISLGEELWDRSESFTLYPLHMAGHVTIQE